QAGDARLQGDLTARGGRGIGQQMLSHLRGESIVPAIEQAGQELPPRTPPRALVEQGLRFHRVRRHAPYPERLGTIQGRTTREGRLEAPGRRNSEIVEVAEARKAVVPRIARTARHDHAIRYRRVLTRPFRRMLTLDRPKPFELRETQLE